MECTYVCPQDAIIIGKGGKARILYNKCIGCGLCVEECPVKALVMNGKENNRRNKNRTRR